MGYIISNVVSDISNILNKSYSLFKKYIIIIMFHF